MKRTILLGAAVLAIAGFTATPHAQTASPDAPPTGAATPSDEGMPPPMPGDKVEGREAGLPPIEPSQPPPLTPPTALPPLTPLPPPRVREAVPPPPPAAQAPRDYPPCTRTRRDSCRNPGSR